MPRAEHSYKRAILDGLKVEYSKASSPLQKAEEVAALLETGGADVTIALAPGGHELGEDASASQTPAGSIPSRVLLWNASLVPAN